MLEVLSLRYKLEEQADSSSQSKKKIENYNASQRYKNISPSATGVNGALSRIMRQSAEVFQASHQDVFKIVAKKNLVKNMHKKKDGVT